MYVLLFIPSNIPVMGHYTKKLEQCYFFRNVLESYLLPGMECEVFFLSPFSLKRGEINSRDNGHTLIPQKRKTRIFHSNGQCVDICGIKRKTSFRMREAHFFPTELNHATRTRSRVR